MSRFPISIPIRRIAPLLAVAIVLSSCVALRPRGEAAGPGAFVVENAPVFRWGDNSCGSAALATLLQHYGDRVTERELDSSFQKGRHGGVLSIDLLLAARARGYDATMSAASEDDVYRNLQERRPVVLMLRIVNAPGAEGDFFHYVVIDGYDPSRKLVRMQFGDGAARWAPLGKIDSAWRGAGRAMIVVDKRSAEPEGLDAALRRAVALEDSGNFEAAALSYASLLGTHPESALVWTNYGNVVAKLDRRSDAEAAFRRALGADSSYRDALNNLAWLLFEEKRFADAETYAKRAADVDGPDREIVFDTLGQIYAAEKKCAESRDAYDRAVTLAGSRPIAATILLSYGRAQVACGDAASAKVLWEKALANAPGDDVAKEIRAELERMK